MQVWNIMPALDKGAEQSNGGTDMKKIIAINGSPRRNGNTAELLQHALRGASDAGAETELVHLYGLKFTGCLSCFYCKRKDVAHGVCALKDDLAPVLERVKEADALIMGAPIYFMNMSAGMLAFIERLFFSNYIYSEEIPTVFPKSPLPLIMIQDNDAPQTLLTMNTPAPLPIVKRVYAVKRINQGFSA